MARVRRDEDLTRLEPLGSARVGQHERRRTKPMSGSVSARDRREREENFHDFLDLILDFLG